MAESGSSANLTQIKAVEAGSAEDKETRRLFNYPLVRFTDMMEEVRVEAVDIVVSAVEKHAGNFEVLSIYINTQVLFY